jgi:tetratricopeptide (TPR) repeat protein
MRFLSLCLGVTLSCALSAQQSNSLQPNSFEILQQTAAKAQEAGNTQDALTAYQRALALKPNWREGLWAVGSLSYDLDRYADAVTALTKLIKLAPNAGPAYSLLGLSEFETAAYPAAQAHLEKAQALGNTDDAAIVQVCAYHLALLLNRSGEFDRALALLRTTFPQQDPPAQAKAAMGIALLHIPLLPAEIDPMHDALLQAAGQAAAIMNQGDPQKSAETLAHLINEYPQTPWLHETYARVLTSTGRTQQAQAARQEEVRLAKTDIAAFYRLSAGTNTATASTSGITWQQAMQDYSSGDYPRAIAGLKVWVQQKPDDGTAWAVMGLSEFAIKDYDNALIHLQRGEQLGLGASRQAASFAIYRLGLLLNRSGRFDAATAQLATIADYKPMADEVQFALGLSLLRMAVLPDDVEAGRRSLVAAAGQIASLLIASRYDDAFPLFQKLIAQYPQTLYLHYAYGTALESLSQYDEAKAQMKEEARLSPQSPLPWVRLASIALRQHLPGDALPAAKIAVQLAPESADAHYVLGRASLDAGDIAAAVSELEKAVSMAPQSPEPHFALARAYARNGSGDKAQQEREIFARLNALAEQQRAQHGSQAYQGPREAENSSLVNSGNGPPEGSGSPSPQKPQ